MKKNNNLPLFFYFFLNLVILPPRYSFFFLRDDFTKRRLVQLIFWLQVSAGISRMMFKQRYTVIEGRITRIFLIMKGCFFSELFRLEKLSHENGGLFD